MSLRGCSGPQALRCGAEVSDYKRNTLRQPCQKKMINYKAVERKINALLCADRTIKVGAAKCRKQAEKRRVRGWWVVSVVCVFVCVRGRTEMAFLCQMVGGVETKVCVSTGDVTPSINKGCGPFWLTG